MATPPKGIQKAESPCNICPESAPGEVQIFPCSLMQLSWIPSGSRPLAHSSPVSARNLTLLLVCKWFLCLPVLLNYPVIWYSQLEALFFPRTWFSSVLLVRSALDFLSQNVWPHLATPGPPLIPRKGQKCRNLDCSMDKSPVLIWCYHEYPFLY